MNTRILFLSTIVLSLFISCKKDDDGLDDSTKKTTTPTIVTVAQADSAIEICYKKMYYPFGYKLQNLYYAFGGQVVHETPELNTLSLGSSSGATQGTLRYFMEGIIECNNVIHDVPLIENISATESDAFVAEAKFLRGFYNFYSAIMFNSIPLFTFENQLDTTITSANQDVLLQSAISDFSSIRNSLPLSFDGVGFRNATRGAADAFQGMCYLWLEKWDSAYICFEKVINSGYYDLVMPTGGDSIDYFSAFTSNFTEDPFNSYGGDNNVESIFDLAFFDDPEAFNHFIPGIGTMGNLLQKYYGQMAYSFNNISARNGAHEIFEKPGPAGMAADPRMYATFFFPGDTLEFDQSLIDLHFTSRINKYESRKSYMDSVGVRKFYFPLHYDNDGMNNTTNWTLIRYADILLMYAEADYRKNGSLSTKGLAAINKIRTRVGMPEYTTVTSDDFVKERLRESLYEMNDVLHLIRWSKTTLDMPWVYMPDYNTNFIPGTHEFLPINERIFEKYTGMTQNPGYF